MAFEELSSGEQVAIIKHEFVSLAGKLFDDPLLIKEYIKRKVFTRTQARLLMRCIYKYNRFSCGCCRMFDVEKFKHAEVETELDPLLDLAQQNAKQWR